MPKGIGRSSNRLFDGGRRCKSRNRSTHFPSGRLEGAQQSLVLLHAAGTLKKRPVII